LTGNGTLLEENAREEGGKITPSSLTISFSWPKQPHHPTLPSVKAQRCFSARHNTKTHVKGDGKGNYPLEIRAFHYLHGPGRYTGEKAVKNVEKVTGWRWSGLKKNKSGSFSEKWLPETRKQPGGPWRPTTPTGRGSDTHKVYNTKTAPEGAGKMALTKKKVVRGRQLASKRQRQEIRPASASTGAEK